ncbi:MAG: flagellar hook-basal body complex protein FliE, partial [Syntrophaceae bacterium]|nr:flagellar hook-basal body complex protein FliE [Syntrophaceae bacterium]
MSDMKITGVGAGQGIPQIKPAGSENAQGFEDLMQEAIDKLSQVQTNAEAAVKELASGGD